MVAENAKHISELGGELYRRLIKMAEHFEALRKSLDHAVEAFNGTVGTLEGRVLVTARKLKDLGVHSEELKPIEEIVRIPRKTNINVCNLIENEL